MKSKAQMKREHMEGRTPLRPMIVCGHDRAWPSIVNSHNFYALIGRMADAFALHRV
jgi:hypothetical protein